MKNIKKYIILVIIFILILIVSLIFILAQYSNNQRPMEEGFEFSNEINNKYSKISSRSDYFRVKEIIKSYYQYIAKINGKVEQIIEYEVEGEEYTTESINQEEYKKQQSDNAKKVLYNMLGKEYIREFDITIENIEQKLQKYNAEDFLIDDMYYSELTLDTTAYFIKGSQIKENNLQDFHFMVVINGKNDAFSIYLDEYIQQHNLNNYQENDTVDIKVNEVENNIYNNTKFQSIQDSQIAKELFDDYKKMLKYNDIKLFEILNQEYKIKKFENLESFKQYISVNKEKLQNGNVVEYVKTNKGNYTQYTCIDQNGKYYIFQETAPMQYTIILDTYTIDLPEFTNQYNNAKDETKVLMNIQRVFDAINDGDYKYAYNKLDATFRSNNFKTQADFENYVKQNFFAKNKLASGKTEKQGDIYLYDITISDATGKNTKTITKKFVMQLKEGTDFVMSFGV